VNVNFSLSPALVAGQVDAVIGAFRNFELNQLDILGRPGRAFYPEEEGVPAYDELVYIAHRDSAGDPRLKAFLLAVERATHWLINHPTRPGPRSRRPTRCSTTNSTAAPGSPPCPASRTAPPRSTTAVTPASRRS
jgi:hypothetical protein